MDRAAVVCDGGGVSKVRDLDDASAIDLARVGGGAAVVIHGQDNLAVAVDGRRDWRGRGGQRATGLRGRDAQRRHDGTEVLLPDGRRSLERVDPVGGGE